MSSAEGGDTLNVIGDTPAMFDGNRLTPCVLIVALLAIYFVTDEIQGQRIIEDCHFVWLNSAT